MDNELKTLLTLLSILSAVVQFNSAFCYCLHVHEGSYYLSDSCAEHISPTLNTPVAVGQEETVPSEIDFSKCWQGMARKTSRSTWINLIERLNYVHMWDEKQQK